MNQPFARADTFLPLLNLTDEKGNLIKKSSAGGGREEERGALSDSQERQEENNFMRELETMGHFSTRAQHFMAVWRLL